MKRLVLGTTQLGMNYGIANRIGKPDFNTAKSIIKTAWEAGIAEFDTAQAYGESEYVLGKALYLLGINHDAKVISKLHPNHDHLREEVLRVALEKTLSNLKTSKLFGLLIHREKFLDYWDEGLGEILSGFIKTGIVEHIGVSVYSPNKAIHAINKEGISIVQVPSNILDQRFEKAGLFNLAKDKGKQIYVRSIFLQGLLLMNSDKLPKNMNFAYDALKKWEKFTQEKNLPKSDLALGYVKKTNPNTKIIIGVETLEQLRKNLKSWEKPLPFELIKLAQKKFRNIEEKILNPMLWKNQ